MANVTTAAPVVPIPTVEDDGLSGGSVFCLLFFTAVAVYFGGGMIVRKFVRGAEGPEMIPHYNFWVDLPNLIKDGLIFALHGCQADVSYDRI